MDQTKWINNVISLTVGSTRTNYSVNKNPEKNEILNLWIQASLGGLCCVLQTHTCREGHGAAGSTLPNHIPPTKEDMESGRPYCSLDAGVPLSGESLPNDTSKTELG